MAAITSIVYTGRKFPFPSAGPGALMAEVWQVPASTAGDTQTITAKFLSRIRFTIGPVEHTALTDNTAALTTLSTVAASNFAEFLVVGDGPV